MYKKLTIFVLYLWLLVLVLYLLFLVFDAASLVWRQVKRLLDSDMAATISRRGIFVPPCWRVFQLAQSLCVLSGGWDNASWSFFLRTGLNHSSSSSWSEESEILQTLSWWKLKHFNFVYSWFYLKQCLFASQIKTAPWFEFSRAIAWVLK